MYREGFNLRMGCLPNRVNEMINRSRACWSVALGSVTEHEECFFGKHHSLSWREGGLRSLSPEASDRQPGKLNSA